MSTTQDSTDHDLAMNPADAAAQIQLIHDRVASVFLGDHGAIDSVLRCLIGRGHVLIEDVPGVGKTLLATAVARVVDCTVSRIQLTPDLLPSDIVGVTIIDPDTNRFVLRRGPIFANIVLADEINRTTPRTQSALLEAMSEASVTIDGTVHKLDAPFMVLATQNPYEFEGTYPLPESQLDRFLMRTSLGYPSPDAEAEVLELRPAGVPLDQLEPLLTHHELIKIQNACDQVRVDRSLLDYIVEFANRTRQDERIHVGVSTRGALALTQAARATALSDGRDYAIPEDVMQNILPVCAHRLVSRSSTDMHNSDAANALLGDILSTIPSPA